MNIEKSIDKKLSSLVAMCTNPILKNGISVILVLRILDCIMSDRVIKKLHRNIVIGWNNLIEWLKSVYVSERVYERRQSKLLLKIGQSYSYTMSFAFCVIGGSVLFVIPRVDNLYSAGFILLMSIISVVTSWICFVYGENRGYDLARLK